MPLPFTRFSCCLALFFASCSAPVITDQDVTAFPAGTYDNPLAFLKDHQIPAPPSGVPGTLTPAQQRERDAFWLVAELDIKQDRIKRTIDLNSNGRSDTQRIINTAIRHYGRKNLATALRVCDGSPNQDSFVHALVFTAQSGFPQCEGLNIWQCSLLIEQQNDKSPLSRLHDITVTSELTLKELEGKVCPPFPLSASEIEEFKATCVRPRSDFIEALGGKPDYCDPKHPDYWRKN